MPTAVIMPAGALSGLRRQLSLASLRKLSWLTFASMRESCPAPRAHQPLNFFKRRLEATLMANPENVAGAPASRDHALCAFACHGQRLFAKEIFAGRDHFQSLLLVKRVRRGEHDFFNLPIRE